MNDVRRPYGSTAEILEYSQFASPTFIRNIMSREPHKPQQKTDTDTRRSRAESALRRHLQRMKDAPPSWNTATMDPEGEMMDDQGHKTRLITVPEEEHAKMR